MPRIPRLVRVLRLPAVLPALTLLVTLAACGDGRQPVVLYSPHGRDILELLELRYEEENPEVDVRWLDMGSQEVYDRVRSERANPQADVWFGGPDTIFSRGTPRAMMARVITPVPGPSSKTGRSLSVGMNEAMTRAATLPVGVSAPTAFGLLAHPLKNRTSSRRRS